MSTQRQIELTLDGQRFRLAGTLKLADRPGTHTLLTAHCADCGAPFAQLATAKTLTSAEPVRRCEVHRRHARGARVTSLHAAALGTPPAIEVGDLCRPAAAAEADAGLDTVVLRSPNVGALTVRGFLAAMGDKWPGHRLMKLRTGLSTNGLQTALDRVVELGWMQRVGKGNTTKFLVTDAARAAMAEQAGGGHA